MSLHTGADVPLLVKSANSGSERRISPSWTIAQLKARLEPITGIPAACQKLSLRVSSEVATTIEAADEDGTQLASFPIQPYAELQVDDTRPPSARTNFNDVSAVDKYVMPEQDYESRKDSVLAWKKAQKLGRFDPDAPSIEQQKVLAAEREVQERGVTVNARCQLLPSSDGRRGKVAFVGPVKEIPGVAGAPWVGIQLDEPTGKNDGSVAGTKYFDAGGKNRGVFVRAERIEVGNFPPLGLDEGEDMEEI